MILVTLFITIHSFFIKLVNYTASYFIFLNEKIDKINDILKKKEANEYAIQEEIKSFVQDHTDALQ